MIAAIACGGSDRVPATPAISAAEHATFDRTGGTLLAADSALDVTYRLAAVPGTYFGRTEVTLAPVTAIETNPFKDGLLAAVQIEFATAPLWPVKLEIELGAEPAMTLRDSLNEEMVAIGFGYDDVRKLSARLVKLSDDRSMLELDVFTSGIHGVLIGDLGDLKKLPMPDDPDARFEQGLVRALYEESAGGEEESFDGAIQTAEVRAKLGTVLQEWLNESVFPRIDQAVADPAEFDSALRAAVRWHRSAFVLRFVSDVWYAPGDEWFGDALALSFALTAAQDRAIRAANERCATSNDPYSLLRLIDADRQLGLGMVRADHPLFQEPGAFCVTLEIAVVEAAPSMAEGSSSRVSFDVVARVGDLILTDEELAILGVEGTFTPVATSLVTLSSVQRAAGDRLNRFSVDIGAGGSRRGSDWEGSLELRVTLFDGAAVHAERTVRIDIEPRSNP